MVMECGCGTWRSRGCFRRVWCAAVCWVEWWCERTTFCRCRRTCPASRCLPTFWCWDLASLWGRWSADADPATTAGSSSPLNSPTTNSISYFNYPTRQYSSTLSLAFSWHPNSIWTPLESAHYRLPLRFEKSSVNRLTLHVALAKFVPRFNWNVMATCLIQRYVVIRFFCYWNVVHSTELCLLERGVTIWCSEKGPILRTKMLLCTTVGVPEWMKPIEICSG